MKLLQIFRSLSWKIWLKIALCLCAVVALGWFACKMLRPGPGTVEMTGEGVVVHMPKLPLPTNHNKGPGLIEADPMRFCSDRAYYTEAYYLKSAEKWQGTKHGEVRFRATAKTTEDGLPVYLGNVNGDLYTVEGCDPTFMLRCDNVLYIRAGGYVVKYGSEIIRDQLHLPGNYNWVGYWEDDEWVSITDRAAVERFLELVCEAEFLPSRQASLQDDQKICSLVFFRDHGLCNTLILYQGGYVCYDIMKDVCVKLPETEFDTFLAALRQ